MVKGGNKMKEISSFTLDDFLDLPKNRREKAIKVSGVGVFIPFSRSYGTEEVYPTFVNKTVESIKRNIHYKSDN